MSWTLQLALSLFVLLINALCFNHVTEGLLDF